MARIAGLFYLLTIVTGTFAFLMRGRPAVAMLLASSACYVVVTLLFYVLFKPVNGIVSLVAAIFSLAGCTVSVLNAFHILPLRIGPLAFFGVYCVLIGYLIFRSGFLPRALGVLMVIGGAGWLTFASATLARSLSPFNMLPGVIAETALTFWLLAFGVKSR
jgi:hypothetical protein